MKKAVAYLLPFMDKEKRDNLIAQGETEKRRFRFPLYQMYARALGYTGKRWILPRCVYLWVDRHFVDEGEERTGFKAK